jgi:hypothetical protein
VCHEDIENRERPRADTHWNKTALVLPEQGAGTPVEPESLEQENVGGDWRVHNSGCGSPTLATFQDILGTLGTFHRLLIARVR